MSFAPEASPQKLRNSHWLLLLPFSAIADLPPVDGAFAGKPQSFALGLRNRLLAAGILLSAGCFCALGFAKAASADAIDLLKQPGHVLLLRHANAPGVGDPPGMMLSDCSTQRNLDDRGRAQARELGQRLREVGITGARIYTSQWCRCRETARLLDIGSVQDLPALNSTFSRPESKASQIQELRAFIDQLPRDGQAVVFVTHQITITALTGYYPDSGEGLILKLNPEGGFDRAADLSGAPSE
jgi:phosphohistidine phosphatase SixA